MSYHNHALAAWIGECYVSKYVLRVFVQHAPAVISGLRVISRKRASVPRAYCQFTRARFLAQNCVITRNNAVHASSREFTRTFPPKTEMEHMMDQGEEEKENNVEMKMWLSNQQKENENKLKLQV